VRTNFVASLILYVVTAAWPRFAGAERLRPISFDYPGATNTQATGITPSGDIVGRYTSPDGVLHGFLLTPGNFKSIDVPDSVSTDVTWINPRGQIVGDYVDAQGKGHGYLLSNGAFTTIDYPTAEWTDAFGIGANGDIIGIYGDSLGTIHGYQLSKGSFTAIDVPGATGSLPTMIAAGRIVGGSFSNTGTHGFLLKNGAFQTIDCPGATFTFLSGIDPQGQMVGGYGTFDGQSHGALIKNGNCIAVDIPGGTNAYANGINPEGDIVGRYTGADGVVHGFLLRDFVENATPIYSAAHDFSFTLNPNAVWSYGYTTTVGGPFSLYITSGSTYFSNEAGWFGPIAGCCAPGYPLVVAGPNQIPTVLDMGPGPASYTVVRWTSPGRGRWDVVGQFFGTGLTTGDVHVLHNGVAVFDSPVNGSQVVKFSLEIDVAPGDTVDFAAGPGPNGNNDNDPTGFNVTVTPER
jgi:hypothetical protein